jgi:glycosyltransferase involved in cell wall biosynthesis
VTAVEGTPLRVLVVSRSYPSDLLPMLGLWVERPTQLLAERCDVRVISSTPWCPPLPPIGPLRQYTRFRRIPRREVRSGIEILRPRFLAGPGWSLHFLESRAQELGMRRAVARLRRSFPFDLVHAHMVYPEGAVAHRLSRRYGLPFVLTEHAPWSEQWFASAAVRREALAAGRAAASVLAVSTSVKETIASYGIESSKVRVVPVGVDPDRFRLDESETREPRQILYVGWLNYNKGIDDLLHAVDLIRRDGERVRLLLVGSAAYRKTRLEEEALRRLADSLGLADAVVFLGRQPQDEVARLMRQSAVLVLPSQAESFGAVLVEALASGTPVVATRSGGPEDIVQDGVGVLVPPRDPAKLAKAILEVLARRASFEPERLRRYALSRFSWERVVEETEAAYRSALPR